MIISITHHTYGANYIPRLAQADPLPDEGPAYGSENEDENTEPAISRMGGSDDEGEDLMENMEGYEVYLVSTMCCLLYWARVATHHTPYNHQRLPCQLAARSLRGRRH